MSFLNSWVILRCAKGLPPPHFIVYSALQCNYPLVRAREGDLPKSRGEFSQLPQNPNFVDDFACPEFFFRSAKEETTLCLRSVSNLAEKLRAVTLKFGTNDYSNVAGHPESAMSWPIDHWFWPSVLTPVASGNIFISSPTTEKHGKMRFWDQKCWYRP